MSELKLIQAPVAKEMKIFNAYFRASIKSNSVILDYITQYIIKRKGIQLKPLLVLLSAKLSGEVTNDTYIAASIIELLHTATLIHDDVSNETDVRSIPVSLKALWNSKISVLMGDYLLAKGLLLSVHHKSYSILEIVSQTVQDISEAELLLNKSMQITNINLSEYYMITGKKTASIVSACSKVGSISAHANDYISEKMKSFGYNLGMFLQIKKDLIYFSPKEIYKKHNIKTLKKKLFSLPFVYAFENSNEVERSQVINMVTQFIKPNRIDKIYNFIIDKGGIEYSYNCMIEFKKNAIINLNDLPFNPNIASFTKLMDASNKLFDKIKDL